MMLRRGYPPMFEFQSQYFRAPPVNILMLNLPLLPNSQLLLNCARRGWTVDAEGQTINVLNIVNNGVFEAVAEAIQVRDLLHQFYYLFMFFSPIYSSTL